VPFEHLFFSVTATTPDVDDTVGFRRQRFDAGWDFLAMKLQEAPIMTRSDWHLHRVFYGLGKMGVSGTRARMGSLLEADPHRASLNAQT
jgi:hypothetical protein